MDLVSCRNLLIYLGGNFQSRVLPAFHFALRPGGYLFLGTSENISHHGDLFAPVDKRYRIFQRRDHVAPSIPLALIAGRYPATPGGSRREHGSIATDLHPPLPARLMQ